MRTEDLFEYVPVKPNATHPGATDLTGTAALKVFTTHFLARGGRVCCLHSLEEEKVSPFVHMSMSNLW